MPPGEHLCRAGSSSLTLILPERLDSPRRTPMDSSSEKCLGSRGPGRPERAALAIASPNALEPPAHPHWPAASTLTTAQAPTCPSTPPVNVSRQHSHCLIKVQGFNRSFEKKKKTKLLLPRAQPPGPLPLLHGNAGPGPPRPGQPEVPAYSRRTPAASGAGILSCI